jgi:hypothetical protein
MSPGILGTYWVLTSFGLTALWCATCEITRRLAHRACPCGTCHR